MNAHGAGWHGLLAFSHTLRILAPLRQDLGGTNIIEHKMFYLSTTLNSNIFATDKYLTNSAHRCFL